MKAKQRTKLFWQELEAKLTADSEAPSVFINAAGDLCLNDGTGRQVPPRLVSLFPAAVVEAAKQKSAEVAEQRQREFAEWMQRQEAQRAALDARLDETGFVLLAGENTEMVQSGTLRECRDSLWKVTSQPRDEYAGRGCWVIVDGDGNEVEAGMFDKHGLV